MTEPMGRQIELLFESAAPRLTVDDLGRSRAVAHSPRRLWPAVAGLAALALLAALAVVMLRPDSPADPGVACSAPPPDELALISPLTMTLEPNPVLAGTEAVLTVDGSVGVPAEWQCWNGEQWVLTHYLVRDGTPIEYNPSSTIAFLDLGYPPNRPVEVVIPNVPSGTYRISDTTVENQTEVFVFVEVVGVVTPTTIPSTSPGSTTTAGSTTITAGREVENVPFDVGPLQERGGHSVVWTGEEMIVWGGSANETNRTRFADGAAFDPITDTWRMIAESPLEPRLNHHAVWTGSEMLIVGGGRRNGAAYDPVTDSWRTIAEMPVGLLSLDPITGYSSAVWTGERLVVWDVRGDVVIVYSPAEDVWEVLPGVGIHAVLGVLRWTGQEVIALGISFAGPDLAPLQVARLQEGRWVLTSPAGTANVLPMFSAWSGSELMAWTEYGTTHAYQPVDDAWVQRDPAPAEACHALVEPVEMAGRGVLLTSCDVDSLYEDGVWAVVHIDGQAEARYTVWTGSEILSWGQTCCYGTGEPFEVHAWRWTPPG